MSNLILVLVWRFFCLERFIEESFEVGSTIYGDNILLLVEIFLVFFTVLCILVIFKFRFFWFINYLRRIL